MSLRKRPLPLTNHMMARSFVGTESGTFKKDGVVVTRTGTLMTAAGAVIETNTSMDQFIFHGDLGRGISATVRMAVHSPSGTVVAVKGINYQESAEKRKQLVSELNTLTKLQAPNLVRLFSAFSDQAMVYLVLEYMDLGTLGGLMKIVPQMPENYLSQILYQVIVGLGYMHTNRMIHRDIKPGNVLINSQGWVKLSDFGLASMLSSTKFATSFVGTSCYMSPERMSSDDYTYNADVWSLGIMAFEAATGRYPYQLSGAPNELEDTIVDAPSPSLKGLPFSRDCVDFIDNCLIKDPSARPSCGRLGRHPFLVQHNPNEMSQIKSLAAWFSSMTKQY
eukprot:TRINITY_DN7817_c0_g2_i1.p1 TRINITY_DN7817_c0_g2~~TRINITY_DN7817_c0_g2_i1.p1  ORF type:complete len:335 (+),score=52.13 TRINITY_DN7817_c0_g2_i1:72-1076(+)